MASYGGGGGGGGGGRRHRRIETNDSPVTSMSAVLVIGDDDLLRQILIRLPAKPLFRFKLVSKGWCSLISDPQLSLDWRPPKTASALFIRRYCVSNSDTIEFNYIPLDKQKMSERSIISLDFVSERFGIKIIQSCNGLFLCSDDELTRYYVHNFTTKQFAPIPRPHIPIGNGIASMNLAFDPYVSFHHKILAVHCDDEWVKKGLSSDSEIEIYSSDTKTWTKPRGPIEFPHHVKFGNGVFLNGRIHWLAYYSETSVYYDFSLEKLMPMPMPMKFGLDRLHFGECGGHLHFAHFCKRVTPQFDVFEMESDYSKWFVKCRVDLEPGIRAFPVMLKVYVLCFIGGAEEGDSCLLVYIDGQIRSYNLKDMSFRKVCNLKLRHSNFYHVGLFPSFTFHPCMETLFPV